MPLFSRLFPNANQRRVQRAIADAEEKTEKQMKPLRELVSAIVSASAHCLDGIRLLIELPSATEQQKADIFAFYEFLYFFLHMTMRNASAVMSEPEIKHLQQQLGHVIVATAVDSYFQHWPDDLKKGMTQDFYLNLNTAEVQYAECSSFDTPAPPEGRSMLILERLFARLGEQVASVIGHEGDSVCAVNVARIAIPEFGKINFVGLIQDFKRDSMDLPSPQVYP